MNVALKGNHYSWGHCLQNHGYCKSKEIYCGTKGTIRATIFSHVSSIAVSGCLSLWMDDKEIDVWIFMFHRMNHFFKCTHQVEFFIYLINVTNVLVVQWMPLLSFGFRAKYKYLHVYILHWHDVPARSWDSSSGNCEHFSFLTLALTTFCLSQNEFQNSFRTTFSAVLHHCFRLPLRSEIGASAGQCQH